MEEFSIEPMHGLPPPILTQCNAHNMLIYCRIVIGHEIGLALVDIDLEGKKDGYVKSNVAIMDSKNDTDQNMKEVSYL